MVLTLAIPVRQVLQAAKTSSRCGTSTTMAKIILATGLIVFYGYMMEVFFAWYSGNEYEQYMMVNRMEGPIGTCTGC